MTDSQPTQFWSDDVWTSEELGLKVRPGNPESKLYFNRIKQLWLKELIKQFIFYRASTLEFSSICVYLKALRCFGAFLFKFFPESIDADNDRVVVRVKAAGVNPADWYVVNGLFQIPPALPFTPGFEAAGEVISVGEMVADIKPGTRVLITLPYLSDGQVCFGAFAEQVVVPAQNVVPIPDGVDFAIAAAIPVMYGTAYVALKHRAQLQTGETLLVTGGTGATGSAAIQIGKHLGARVIAVTSGEAKLQRVKDLGSDVAIDYKQSDLTAKLKELTQGRGVDVAFETVGGDIFEAVVNNMASEGRLLPIGMASGIIPELSMMRVLAGNFAVVGTDFANYTLNHIDLVRQGLAEILSWHQSGIFKYLQVKSMPLSAAVTAIEQVHQGAGVKVVLIME